jgi:hypothetical protein
MTEMKKDLSIDTIRDLNQFLLYSRTINISQICKNVVFFLLNLHSASKFAKTIKFFVKNLREKGEHIPTFSFQT